MLAQQFDYISIIIFKFKNVHMSTTKFNHIQTASKFAALEHEDLNAVHEHTATAYVETIIIP